MAISFKGAHFPPDVILMGVRWYVAYPLSTRHVEELMEERGVEVDHSTINRWVIKYSPQLEEAFHRHKRPVWVSWRMDETYIKVKGEWQTPPRPPLRQCVIPPTGFSPLKLPLSRGHQRLSMLPYTTLCRVPSYMRRSDGQQSTGQLADCQCPPTR